MAHSDTNQVDRLLDARIAGQSGLVTRAQALRGGYSPDAIRWRLSSGRWVQVHRGVYLTTPGRDDWELRAVAALLTVGTPSALCDVSAGIAWGLAAVDSADLRIVVPYGRNGADRPGITVVRSRLFAERVHPMAWPHRTTAEHTIFDMAMGRDLDRVAALMAKGCQLGITTERALGAALSTRTGQTHGGLVAEMLGLVGAGAESAAEARFIRDVEQAHGLPAGISQEPATASRMRDRTFGATQVIVEIDGRLGHAGWSNRLRDGRRDRKHARGGWLTVRGGWPDVAGSPCEFADDLVEIFVGRGWRGSPRACRRGECVLRRRAA